MKNTVVVLGPQEVADAVRAADQFEVLCAPATSGFRDLVQGPLRGLAKASLVYLIADTLTLDSPNLSLERLIDRMSTSGHHVVLLGYTANASDLAQTFPAAGLLRGPFETNSLLAAIAGKTGWQVAPVANDEPAAEEVAVAAQAFAAFPSPSQDAPAPDGFPPMTKAAPAPAASAFPAMGPAPQTPTAAFPAMGQAPAAPAPEMAPAGQAFGPVAPTAAFGPAAPSPAPAPSGGGFGPAAPSAPVFGDGAPAAPTFGPAAPAETPPQASPFGSFTLPTANTSPTQSAFGPLTPLGQPGRPSLYVPGQGGGRRSLVVAVAAPKGGVGKTTLTVNLAAYAGLKLLPHGKRVAIIDANSQQADIGKILSTYSPTLNDIARDPAYRTPAQIQKWMAHFPDINVDVVLGPNTVEEANPTWITNDLFNTVANSLRELYDIIFIDCPVAEPHREIFLEFILPQADFLIMPVNPSNVTLQNARSWLGHLGSDPTSGVAYNKDKVGILLNQAQENVDVDADKVRENLPQWKFLAEIRSSKEWIRASNNNELVAVASYADVNAAFARVMFDITGDEVFGDDVANLPAPSRRRRTKSGDPAGGLFAKLLGGLRK